MTTKKDAMLAAGHVFSFVWKHSIVFHKWVVWFFFPYRKPQNLVSCIAIVGAALCTLDMRCCKLKKYTTFPLG